MLLQSTITQSPLHPLSQNHAHLSTSLSSPSGLWNSTIFPQFKFKKPKPPSISCSISQVHNYGTMDYEKKPMEKWNGIYRRISLMENTEKSAAGLLNQTENEGRKLTKWELCRIVKELRKFRRFNRALEIYEWMNSREERFTMTTSDTAIQLDLIAKVHGISSAEDYFMKLPDSLKDKRIYGALLNAYARAKMKDKAESLIAEMKDRGYASHALPFNVMMTLYMNGREYDKLELLVSEMMDKQIPLDIYSYNIWLSSRGSQGSAEKMEQVYEQLKLDRSVNPTWATFSTMATHYIRMGQVEKAEEYLKKIEDRITGRDRLPYQFLISLYGSAGKKGEVERIWNTYKSVFPTIPNLSYHSMISSLLRLDDIEGAEKIYEEWVAVKSAYDPRIGNRIMGWYVKKGFFERARAFFEAIDDVGGKKNSITWEFLGEIHIKEKRISEALSCLKQAVSAEGAKFWKPKPVNVCSILKLCEQESDEASKEVLLDVLRQMGCLDDKVYMSYIPLSTEVSVQDQTATEEGRTEDDVDDSESLLNQLQGSL